jgi:hypothetical protein
MSKSQSQLIIDKISKNLINSNFDPRVRGEGEVIFSNKNFMFEQYRLLIDSAHKIEERRSGSNNVFIGINTIIVSVLVNSANSVTTDIIRIPFLVSLILIGMLVAWDWLKVTASYKKLNFLNYSLIESFESLLPTFAFSLRAKIEAEEAEEKLKNRANIILKNESLLPKAFLFIYTIALFTILFRLITIF